MRDRSSWWVLGVDLVFGGCYVFVLSMFDLENVTDLYLVRNLP